MKDSLSAGLMIMVFLLTSSVSDAAEEKGKSHESSVPPVVANINGKEITKDKYMMLWRQNMQRRGGEGNVRDSKEIEIIKEQVMERLIILELLNQRADEIKIKISQEEIENRIREDQKRAGGEDALDRALKANGMTRDAYRADVGTALKVQRVLAKEALGKTIVDPKEVQAFFKANPQSLKVPEQVRARHILIMVPQGATGKERKKARETLETAAERIRKGESFGDVAREVSQDGGSAPDGGDLGYFGRGRMVPEFEQAAFSLNVDEISKVVETKYGYHLIKVVDKKASRDLSFEEAEPKITAYLKRRKEEDSFREYVAGLKAKASIERIPF
jgi:peptidyl-prolyl cis-trans isomerase C